MIDIQIEEENNAETTTGDAFVRMRELVQHFTTSDLCAKRSTVVNGFTGKSMQVRYSVLIAFKFIRFTILSTFILFCFVFLGTVVAIHNNLESTEFLKGVRQGMSSNITEYLVTM